MTRTMPAKIWNRGKQIALDGAVEIEYIDNVAQEVEATVFGTQAYGVSVNAKDSSRDYCECPYFPDHGYCKHIAAVIKLLKSQGRPLENLFHRATDDQNFAAEMGADYLDISAQFEALLDEFPEIGRLVYTDKQIYDQMRADPDSWGKLFDETDLAPTSLNKLRTQYANNLVAKPKPRPEKTSGQYFLEQLSLPAQQFFTPLEATDSEEHTLRLEVTLVAIPMTDQWGYESITRLCVKLRIATADKGRFYVVNNIERLLQAYKNGATYLTNSKHEFVMTATAFAPAERVLLDFLMANSTGESVERYYGGGGDKFFALPVYDFPRTLAILAAVPEFKFEPIEQQTLYDNAILVDLQPEAGLFKATITTDQRGYRLAVTSDFDQFINANLIFVRGNVMYQVTRAQFNVIAPIINNYNEILQRRSNTKSLRFPAGSEAELSRFIELFQQIGVIDFPVALAVGKMVPHFDLDRQEQTLVLSLAYDYNGQLIASDDIGAADVTRNLPMEEQAFDYLQSLGLRKVGRYWRKDFADAAALYHFFVAELPNMQQNGVVTMTPALTDLLHDASEIVPQIDVTEEDGLLAVNFSISGIAEDEVDQVLAQLDVSRPYIDRGDGSIVIVDDQLKKVSAALAKVRAQGKIKNGKVEIPASQALAVQAALGDTAQFDQKFQQLLQNLAHPEAFPVVTHATNPVAAQLRPYQKVGVKWLEMLNSYNFGGILADEMGLGKTLQMITFLNNHLAADRFDLIVAPASLIYNWQAEFTKFAPTIKVAVVDGTKAQRQALIAQGDADVLITSYNSARLDITAYLKRRLKYLVLDEAQYVKNSSTQTNQNLRKLKPQNTFALSGTPIENRAEELWALFALVLPGLLPSKKAFNKLMPDEIAVRVKPFILRREKAAVLKDLPAKVESNLYNEMSKEQKKVYLAQLKQMQVKVRGMSKETLVKNSVAILAGLTRLRQICDTPALFVDDYPGESGKLTQLLEILQQAQENQHRVLIFSQFTGMLNIIAAALKQQGLDSFMLQGNTKPKDRLAMVDAFNAGKKSVFLISLKAGGTGLNLTGADTVILVDLWWNPAVEDQATARAHRIGQTKTVEVYRLITKGTIEEQIYKLQEEKRNFVDQVLSGTENKGSLTAEEVRLILGIE